MDFSFTYQKCGHYEKLIEDHFSHALGTLLPVVNSLKGNGPGLQEVLSKLLSVASEETGATSTEMSTLDESVDFERESLKLNMEGLTLGKQKLEGDLVNLQMQLKHALESRDHAKRNWEMQTTHLANLRTQLKQKHLMIEEIEVKIKGLLPWTSFGGGIGIYFLQENLEEVKKEAEDLEEAVSRSKEAISQATKTWEDASQRAAIAEAEVASVDKRISETEDEMARMKAREQELSEKSQQLKKGDQFLRALHGKVEAARVIARLAGASEFLTQVFKEIGELIQRTNEESEGVPCLFTAAVRELAVKLPAAVKLLAKQAH